MGEDRAINAMLNGATDYVLKNKLERLVPAIKRAINEHELAVKQKQSEEELRMAYNELSIQNKEKDKRAKELIIANKELAFQNREKEKRADELVIANKELLYQNDEKEKRAAELFIANVELDFQNTEKGKRAAELIISMEKAVESDRLKSAFLANMSHEIRTPMNGILGFTELLKNPNLTIEKKEYYISIIEKSGMRLLNIINDILSISKIESGQMEVFISETNVNEQIEYIYNFFKPEAERKKIQISFKNNLPGEKSIIKTDKEKIYAILTNLVKNALKFTKTGSIEIGYHVIEKLNATTQLEFFVKDTGVGIRSEQLKIVFERFRQGSESLNRTYEGAGLGLTISKAFIEMLGGKIWIESEFGIGSTVYFTIPYNDEQEEKIVSKNIILADDEINPMNKLNVLIAEDDEDSELLLSIAIEKFSKRILNVRTGIKAVEVCRNNPDLDLVLMDVKMPEMDGYEATRQIRKFNKNVVIIAQTAFAQTGDREKSIEPGCNDFITKPINKNEFIGLMQKHFKKLESVSYISF
jgi:signal transduction histidine kinase/CheY-like chemotaxis protein